MAHEIGQIKMKLEDGKMITDEEKRKLQLKAMLKKDISRDQKMEVLKELLFEENEKSVYQQRYESNKELSKEEDIPMMSSFGFFGREQGIMEKLHFAKKVDLGTKEYRIDEYKEIYENTEIPKDIMQSLKEPDKEKEQDYDHQEQK